MQRVLSEAEHALAFGQGTQAAGVIGLRKRASLGQQGATMLHAVADAVSGDDPARVFEYLCARVFDEGARTGIPVTPPELAELMLDLAASPVPAAGADSRDRSTASGKGRLLLDPACGSGTILLAAARRGWERVEGQEQDSSLALVAAIRLAFLRDASPEGAAFLFDVHAGDSLRRMPTLARPPRPSSATRRSPAGTGARTTWPTMTGGCTASRRGSSRNSPGPSTRWPTQGPTAWRSC